MKSVLSFFGGVIGLLAGSAGLLGQLPHAVQIAVQAIAGVLTVLGIRAAQPTGFTDFLNRTLGGGWKTVAGILVWAVGVLLSPNVFATLPASVAHLVSIAGALLTALGLYHAQAAASTAKG